MNGKVIWYLVILIVLMFAIVALIPYISSGDQSSLTAFILVISLDLAIIVFGYLLLFRKNFLS